MNTTKIELCRRVRDKLPGKTIEDIKPIIEILFDEILMIVAEGGRIEIRGFGAFSLKKRKARLGRNPRTKVEAIIPERLEPHLKFSGDAQKTIEEALQKTPLTTYI